MNKILIVSTIFIIGYIVGVNLVANTLISFGEISFGETEGYSISDVELKLSTQVSWSIKRPRWYGTIYEAEEISNLDVFNIFQIPIKVKGHNWGYFHLVVLGLTIFISNKKIKKQREEKWDSDNSYNSSDNSYTNTSGQGY